MSTYCFNLIKQNLWRQKLSSSLKAKLAKNPKELIDYFNITDSCELPATKWLLLKPLVGLTCVDVATKQTTNPVQLVSISDLFKDAAGSFQAIQHLKKLFAGKSVFSRIPEINLPRYETKYDLVQAIASKAGLFVDVEPTRRPFALVTVCSQKLRDTLPFGEKLRTNLDEIGCNSPVKRALMDAMSLGYELL